MLRITICEGPTAKTIQLEGKISGPWVQELQRTWESMRSSLGSKGLQIDLRGIAFVDNSGRQVLREIYRRTKAIFLANSPLTQYYADDAMQKCSEGGEEGV
jgi:anti-anti-sigma regulatory factor